MTENIVDFAYTMQNTLNKLNHERDLREFIRLSEIGYRRVDSSMAGEQVVFYVDPFQENPVEILPARYTLKEIEQRTGVKLAILIE